ncbi:MAG: sodium:solute symporter [Planctomycetota bacterium]
MDYASAHKLDIAVMVVYLVASFAIGIIASRMMNTSSDEEGFYLAGRKIPGWMNGISYAVTAMNADVAPLYCGLTVVIGLPVAWYYLSRFTFAWLLVSLLFAVRWWHLKVHTGPEFYSLRFGGRGAKAVRVLSALFSVAINMVPWLGAGLLGMHKIFSPIFGFESKATTLALVLPVLISYVWISGFAGVVITDVLQSLVIVLASIFLLIAVLRDFGGPTGLATAVQAAHPEEQSEILSVLPVPGHEHLGPLLVVAWLVIPTIGRGGSVDLDGQRLFSARSAQEAAKVHVWAACGLFTMLLLLTLPVLGVLANQPELYHATSSEGEKIYGTLLQNYLPAGLLGVALAALLASVMSTIDSHLNYGSQTIVNDVLRQLFPRVRALDPSTATCVWIGRLVMLVVLGFGVLVMFQADSLIKIAVVISGMFASSAAFYWAQWWWWRVNLQGWIAAMIGGPVVYLGLSRLLPLWPWWQEQIAVSTSTGYAMDMLQAAISIGLTTILWVGATFLFPPEQEATLDDFYRRARPLGAWGPVRRRLREQSGGHASEAYPYLFIGGLLTAAIGTAWIAAAVLAVSQLVVGNFGRALGLAACAALGGLVFARLFSWHVGRMEASQVDQTYSDDVAMDRV